MLPRTKSSSNAASTPSKGGGSTSRTGTGPQTATASNSKSISSSMFVPSVLASQNSAASVAYMNAIAAANIVAGHAEQPSTHSSSSTRLPSRGAAAASIATSRLPASPRTPGAPTASSSASAGQRGHRSQEATTSADHAAQHQPPGSSHRYAHGGHESSGQSHPLTMTPIRDPGSSSLSVGHGPGSAFAPLASNGTRVQSVSSSSSVVVSAGASQAAQRQYNQSPPSPRHDNAPDHDVDDDDDSSIGISDSDEDEGDRAQRRVMRMVDQKARQQRGAVTGDDGDRRPLTPASAIAAAFRKMQADHEALQAEHSQCERKLRAAQSTASEATRSAAAQVRHLEMQLDQCRRELDSAQLQASSAAAAAAARDRDVQEGNALLLHAKHWMDAQAVEAATSSSQVNQLRRELDTCKQEVLLLAGKLRIAEDVAASHAKEAATATARLSSVATEAATARADAVRANAECAEYRKKAMMLASQVKAAETTCSELRKTIAQLQSDVAAAGKASIDGYRLRCVKEGCDRCRAFDLPDVPRDDDEAVLSKQHRSTRQSDSKERGADGDDTSDYHGSLATHRGPWFSVDAVRGAVAEASSVRLVVLAPTVRVTVSGHGGGASSSNSPTHKTGAASSSSSPSTTAGADAVSSVRSSLPMTSITATLQTEVLPRFAAVFATPQLRAATAKGTSRAATSKSATVQGGGSGGNSNNGNDFSGGPYAGNSNSSSSASADIDAWLRRLLSRLESDVVDAIAGSGHFRVVGRGSELA